MNSIAKNFSVVIVIYNTKLENSITFSSLTNSLKEINDGKVNLVVYDNSPKSQEIESDSFPEWSITYIHDLQNPGVSKAYNVAAKISRKLGLKWILLTDQDTEFPKNAISSYLESVNNYKDIKLFVPILKSGGVPYSPCKYYFGKGVIWKKASAGVYSLKNKSVLNSGIFVNLDAFTSAGGYNESIQLYFSDFDFISRFEKIFPNFCVIDLLCNHELSDVVKVDLGAAKRRFNYYCEGAYQSSNSKLHFIQLFITIFLRSVKLSVKYKSIEFLKIFFKYYLR